MADRYQNYPGAAGGAGRRPAAAPDSDPLAELARLIGQTDPQSPFARNSAPADVEREPHYAGHDAQPESADVQPAQPSWMRAAATADWQQARAPSVADSDPQQQDYSDQQQHPDHSQAPAFLRTMRQHDSGSKYDDALYGARDQHPGYADHDAQHQDAYAQGADPNAYQPYYEDAVEEEKPKRSGMMTVIAVLALAVVGTGGAFAYRYYTGPSRSGEPPVIKAETGANKVVPPTQTGDAGKIVDRIGGSANGQERVLPREEQPVDINGRNAPRVVFPPLNQGGGAPALAQPATTPAAARPATPQQQAATTALGDEPKRVRTLSIRSDQPDTAPNQAAARPAAPGVARAQAAAPSGNSPMSLSPQAPATPVRTTSVSPSSGSGGYVVQISSQRSEADAQASYRAMQSKFPNVLGSRSAMIRRADLGEKGVYYRAMVGPFAAADDAGQLCGSLKAAGGQCVVQRN